MSVPAPMRPKVKICGLTRPEDVEAAVEEGADFCGFIRYAKSPRFVADGQLRDLLRRVPEGRRVLVDVAPSVPLLAAHRRWGFDSFQIHFSVDFPLATISAWAHAVGPDRLWLAPRLPPEISRFPQGLLPHAGTFVVDAYAPGLYGGSGKTADWERFKDGQVLYQHKRWVLAGGLNPANVGQALRETGARFIDASSGVESIPGTKDHQRLRAFFSALPAVDARPG